MPTIVLVNPQLPENIGFTCRSMLNFELKNLTIVITTKNKHFSNLTLHNLPELLKNTDKNSLKDLNITITNNLQESLKNFNTVIALTARKRYLTKPSLSLNNLFLNISNTNNMAIMFGCEKNGLSNEQLKYANYLVNINTNVNYSSLNLSHAVALVAYEYFNFKNTTNTSTNILQNNANVEHLEYFFKDLFEKLDKTDFFANENRKQTSQNNIRTIYQKNNLTKKEVDTLLAINKFLFNLKV